MKACIFILKKKELQIHLYIQSWSPLLAPFHFVAISSEMNGKEPNLHKLVLSFAFLYRLGFVNRPDLFY